MTDRERDKQHAAEAAALLIEDGMRVGLGTGSTVAYFLPALARRGLDLTCVATSPRTEHAARALGLRVRDFTELDRLDIAVDGADEVAPDRWLVKGGGGAHTREKIVAAAADRFVVIVDRGKLVEHLRPPVPVELLGFGLPATLATVARVAGPAVVRAGAVSPDGGVLADVTGWPAGVPAELLAARLSAVPGLVGHGLFPPDIVGEVLVGDDDGCRPMPG